MTGIGFITAFVMVGGAIFQSVISICYNAVSEANPTVRFKAGLWIPLSIATIIGIVFTLPINDTINDERGNENSSGFEFDPKLGEMDPALLICDD